MTEDEILVKAQQMAEQHKQEMIDARISLTRDMLAAGYKPAEWVICDNLADIQNGADYTYRCWAAKANPTKL